MSNERIHVATILLGLTNGLYNIKIDDRNELAYLHNGLLYTLDIDNISYSEGMSCSKLDIDMKCKGNVVPLWKCMNITSIKHINSDDELCTNEEQYKKGDSCEYFDEGACDAGSIDLDDNGVCVTFRRKYEQEEEE